MTKAKLVLLLVVLLLPLAAPGRASGPYSVTGAVSGDAAFLATLQAPQVGAPPAAADQPAEAVLKTNFCTKEVCSVARADCRAWCPFPCVMTFECNYPTCGSCISCSC
jgi:hypothetical protein